MSWMSMIHKIDVCLKKNKRISYKWNDTISVTEI